ncbi:MAG TPA: response regulator transcription factor [Verrucomicrobiales bacterium]|nr:response regulator transcription factor [Verrucomicrobiales bacterium]
MARILIIEDELAMRTALAETLRGHGYRTLTAHDGVSGLEKACTERVDLILLDIMMPGLDGFALCREIRRRGIRVPVLMLTAKGMVDDRVQGLDSGADDYLVKPFSMKELVARIRALLRRSESERRCPQKLVLGTLTVDFPRQTCQRDGKPIELSDKEMRMLRLLAEKAGEAVSRDEFLDVVWEYNAYPTTRTVDNFIHSLRAKLEPDPDNPRYIVTVRGIGYRLTTEG